MILLKLLLLHFHKLLGLKENTITHYGRATHFTRLQDIIKIMWEFWFILNYWSWTKYLFVRQLSKKLDFFVSFFKSVLIFLICYGTVYFVKSIMSSWIRISPWRAWSMKKSLPETKACILFLQPHITYSLITHVSLYISV